MAAKLTAEAWDNSRTPRPLLEHVGAKLSRRRRLLLVYACCRRLAPVVTTPGGLDPLPVVERFADDPGASAEAKRARQTAIAAARAVLPRMGGTPAERGDAHAVLAVSGAVQCVTSRDIAGVFEMAVQAVEFAGHRSAPAERAAQATLVREVIGNPFRPVRLDPAWLSSPVLALAGTMYDARDFASLPILADALEEAGCDQPDVLAHCRGPGPHIRGCWVIDLVLGKS